MARVIFMGTPRFAVPSLDALIQHHDVIAVVTQPDRRGGRGRRKLIPPPVKEVALEHDIPVMQPANLRDDEMVAELRELAPEVIVIAAYGEILTQKVLDIPPKGCINVHASLLPRHRGAAPVAAALLHGDDETGVTVMLVERKLDAGDILAQRSVPIAPDDTTGTLTPELAQMGADLLIETLPKWLNGEITPQPQNEEEATYFGQIQRGQGCIDWTRSALEIANILRAFDPWPGVYTFCGDSRLKILAAHPLPDWRGDAKPGEVIELEEGTAVATGQGALVLDKVQAGGKRAMACEQFICGQQDFVGSTLTEEGE